MALIPAPPHHHACFPLSCSGPARARRGPLPSVSQRAEPLSPRAPPRPQLLRYRPVPKRCAAPSPASPGCPRRPLHRSVSRTAEGHKGARLPPPGAAARALPGTGGGAGAAAAAHLRGRPRRPGPALPEHAPRLAAVAASHHARWLRLPLAPGNSSTASPRLRPPRPQLLEPFATPPWSPARPAAGAAAPGTGLRWGGVAGCCGRGRYLRPRGAAGSLPPQAVPAASGGRLPPWERHCLPRGFGNAPSRVGRGGGGGGSTCPGAGRSRGSVLPGKQPAVVWSL